MLVVELMGRSNGVGFEIGVAFHLFDIRLLLAYAIPFVIVMLAMFMLVLQRARSGFAASPRAVPAE